MSFLPAFARHCLLGLCLSLCCFSAQAQSTEIVSPSSLTQQLLGGWRPAALPPGPIRHGGPYAESFEQGWGRWQAAPGWTRQRGPAIGHGPQGAANQDYYLYLSGTAGQPDQAAALLGPELDLRGLRHPRFYLRYHATGQAALRCEVSADAGQSWHPLWQHDPASQADWRQVSFSLADYREQVVRIRLVGTPGSGSLGVDALYFKNAMAMPGDVVYGYRVNDDATAVEGPVWFSKSTPNVLNLIQAQNSQNILLGGTWAFGKWYAMDYIGQQLVTIDTATGFRTVVGPTTGAFLTCLAFDPTTGTLYGMGDPTLNNASANNLYTLDTLTGAATLVGTNSGFAFVALSCDSSGNLYSLELNDDELYQIDKATGVATLIGPIGYDANQTHGMEFDPLTGTQFLAATERIFFLFQEGDWRQISPTTGAATFLSTFQDDAEVGGIAFPSNAAPPVANFSLSASTICAGDSVAFTNASTGGISAYQWMLAGANPDSTNVSDPVVAYQSPGTYDVTLVVTGFSGDFDTLTLLNAITVQPLPTVAFGTIADTFCLDDPPVALSGTPGPGTFAGPGVSGATFAPNAAGVGAHWLTYTHQSLSTGCSNLDSAQVAVLAPPVVQLTGPDTLCLGVAPVLLGITTGAVVSGPGVGAGGTFDPVLAGVGTHWVTASLVGPGGCEGQDSLRITVVTGPSVSFPALDTVCLDAGPISLSGATPGGGTYFGPGVAGGSVDPAVLGPGTHWMYYLYQAANGCVGTDSSLLVVQALPTVQVSGPTNVCVNEGLVALAITPGATLTGPGSVGNDQFDPALAGPGTHVLQATVLDSVGCSNQATWTITVADVTTASFTVALTWCVDDASVPLTGGQPQGGTYAGAGVSGGSFDPALAGVGSHTLRYVFVNALGCSDTATQTVEVRPLPVIAIAPLDTVCLDAGPQALTANPAGGVFSGPGVSGSQFDPAGAGQGSHTLRYAYTDSLGCSQRDSIAVQVVPGPQAQWQEIPSTFCEQDVAFALPVGTPGGGSFTGPGITGGQFVPSAAGVGTHALGYVVSANGCADTAYQTVEVLAVPIQPTLVQVGDTLYSSWGGVNQWYLDGVLLVGENAPELIAPLPGVYTVVAVADNGCTRASDSLTVALTQVAAAWPPDWRVYPTPTRDHLYVVLSDLSAQAVALRLIDPRGRAVAQWTLRPRGGQVQQRLALPKLAEGVYALQVALPGKGLRVWRVVVR